MKWMLINPAGTNDPDTGDIYSGLDRFGRVKDNRWLDGAGADLDRIQYGYDRASNRIWRRNVVAAALGKEFDELYGYDGIHRLKHMARGTLNGGRTALTSETFAQCWTLDSTGNWQGFREDDTGNGTWDLVQQRSANAVNEISNIAETAGPSWVTPAYSRAGNMTTLPQPADPTQSYTATYDAWNRLVKIADGSDTVSEYTYDGARRRIMQKSYSGGVLEETRHLYYTRPSMWQVLEERVGTSPDSADAERQFVWGKRYIDDLVLRDRDTDDDGSLDERLYACQDANWNVTAITDNAESVQERFAYEAYGTPLYLNSGFVPHADSFNWGILYGGYRRESETGLFHVRNRFYLNAIGTWIQRDPLGYVDGLALYAVHSPLQSTDPTGMKCTVTVCSSPIPGVGAGGHLFIIVDGKAYRAGPGRSPNDPPGKGRGDQECECRGRGRGQLVPDIGPWDKTFGDHPDYRREFGGGYDKNQLKCRDSETDGDCAKLSECMEHAFNGLSKCCIPYEILPELGQLDGNSNSAVVWALSLCADSQNPTRFIPPDKRANPGTKQSVPKCLKEYVQGRQQ